jgi:hypothetical protein
MTPKTFSEHRVGSIDGVSPGPPVRRSARCASITKRPRYFAKKRYAANALIYHHHTHRRDLLPPPRPLRPPTRPTRRRRCRQVRTNTCSCDGAGLIRDTGNDRLTQTSSGSAVASGQWPARSPQVELAICNVAGTDDSLIDELVVMANPAVVIQDDELRTDRHYVTASSRDHFPAEPHAVVVTFSVLAGAEDITFPDPPVARGGDWAKAPRCRKSCSSR